jgi:hypothetical protein
LQQTDGVRESLNLESYQNSTKTVMDEGEEGRRTMGEIYKGPTTNFVSIGLYGSQIDPRKTIHSLSRGLQAGACPNGDGTPPEEPYGLSHFSQLILPNMRSRTYNLIPRLFLSALFIWKIRGS